MSTPPENFRAEMLAAIDALNRAVRALDFDSAQAAHNRIEAALDGYLEFLASEQP
jgi:hypothetical protein